MRPVATSKYTRVTAMSYCIMVRLMTEAPHSYAELVEGTGLSRRAVANWVTEMRRQRLVHIAAWGEDHRGFRRVAEFAWGDRPDVKRPCFTRAETNRRHRAKRKSMMVQRAMHAMATVVSGARA